MGDIQYFPALFFEKTVFSPIEWSSRPCQKLFDHICEGLFLGFQFCFIGIFVRLCASTTLFRLEGNGTPLQYSRLENPMDGGA